MRDWDMMESDLDSDSATLLEMPSEAEDVSEADGRGHRHSRPDGSSKWSASHPIGVYCVSTDSVSRVTASAASASLNTVHGHSGTVYRRGGRFKSSSSHSQSTG